MTRRPLDPDLVRRAIQSTPRPAEIRDRTYLTRGEAERCELEQGDAVLAVCEGVAVWVRVEILKGE